MEALMASVLFEEQPKLTLLRCSSKTASPVVYAGCSRGKHHGRGGEQQPRNKQCRLAQEFPLCPAEEEAQPFETQRQSEEKG